MIDDEKMIFTKMDKKEFLSKFQLHLEQLMSIEESAFENADQLRVTLNAWIRQIKEFISSVFSDKPKGLIKILNSTEYEIDDDLRFDSDYDGSDNPALYREYRRVDAWKRTCSIMTDYFTLFESFNKPALIQSGIQEKKDFILEKLLQVFNDNYYDISILLDLNSIHYRSEEPNEIAEDLARREYVTIKEVFPKNCKVQLTVKGASHIERKIKSRQKGQNEVPKSNSNDLNKKIDDILERLEKMGLGQEVIFNEFEEMRDLQNKLSKKTWSQLLKGKLFDLAFKEIISKDTANFVYEFLTNDKLKLMP